MQLSKCAAVKALKKPLTFFVIFVIFLLRRPVAAAAAARSLLQAQVACWRPNQLLRATGRV